MTEVVKKFPHLCKLERQLEFPERRVRLWVFENVEQNLQDCNDFLKRGNESLKLSETEYPDMSGVRFVVLDFARNGLKSMTINYEKSNSEDFAKGFNPKTKELLGLSQWTNWKTAKTDSLESGGSLREKTETNQLLCNKVMFETELRSLEVLRVSYHPNVNRAVSEATLGAKTHIASLTISESENAASSTTDNQRFREEAEVMRKSKELEDKKKAETFKP